MKVILLAGGYGTRLAEYTDVIPKPMVPVGGKPILWHIMHTYAHYGHKDFYIALGYKAEVIKEYVRTGLGVGICARMSYDRKRDGDLVMLDTSNLFDSSVTSLAIRKNAVMRKYVYDFIQIFASHLSKDVVNKALKAHNDTSLQEKLYQEFVKEAAMR